MKKEIIFTNINNNLLNNKIISDFEYDENNFKEINEFKFDKKWIDKKFSSQEQYYTIHNKFYNLSTLSNSFDNNKKIYKYGINKHYYDALKSSNIKNGVILDYGCSLGHNSVSLKERGNFYYIGADHNLLSLLIGSTVYTNADIFYKINSDEDAIFKHIKDNSIDLIIMSLVNNYRNIDILFKAYLRILKNNGMIFIETHGARGTPKELERQILYKYLKENFKILNLIKVKDNINTLEDILIKKDEKIFKHKISGCFVKK